MQCRCLLIVYVALGNVGTCTILMRYIQRARREHYPNVKNIFKFSNFCEIIMAVLIREKKF